jgi:cell wall assembly regulator SMI1
MAGALDQALHRLESILSSSGAAIVPTLHRGRAADDVRHAFSTLGLVPSAEVSTWYTWHDGAGERGMPTEVIALVPGGEFYDLHALLEDYVQTRRSALELASRPGFPFSADEMWDPSWFPILRLFGKGFIAAEVGSSPSEVSPLHVVWHDDDPELAVRVAWPTVADFVEVVIGRFEAGVYWVDDDGVVQGPTIDFPG